MCIFPFFFDRSAWNPIDLFRRSRFRTRKISSVNKLSTAVNRFGAASSCISLARWEEQTILSGLQSRNWYVVFSLRKSVYQTGYISVTPQRFHMADGVWVRSRYDSPASLQLWQWLCLAPFSCSCLQSIVASTGLAWWPPRRPLWHWRVVWRACGQLCLPFHRVLRLSGTSVSFPHRLPVPPSSWTAWCRQSRQARQGR